MPGTITITDAAGTRVLTLADNVIAAIDAQRLLQTTIDPTTGTQIPQQPDWKNYLIAAANRQVIVPAAQQAAAALLNGTVPAPVTVTVPTIPTLPHGTAMTAVTITASGGSGSGYSYSMTGLPSGMAIGGSSGIISGTPAAAGSFGYTLTVTDAIGNSLVLAGTITVS